MDESPLLPLVPATEPEEGSSVQPEAAQPASTLPTAPRRHYTYTQLFSRQLRYAAIVPVGLVLIMAMLHGIHLLMGWDYYTLGLRPRDWTRAYGVFTMGLVHGDWGHLGANSISFIGLGTLLFLFFPQQAFRVLGWGTLLSGAWLWVFGRPVVHVGASGIVYMLAAFLISSGLIRSNKSLLAMSMLLIFFYGSMIWGVLPIDPHISWEGHLMGMASGVFLSFLYRKRRASRQVEVSATSDIPPEEEEVYPWYEDEIARLAEEQAQATEPPHEALPMIRYRYVFKERTEPDSR